MDGRHFRRGAALIIISAAVGCSSTGPKPAVGPSLSKLDPKLMNSEAASATTVARGTSAPLDPKRKAEPPKASTLIAVAAVKAEMARSAELSFAEAEQTRAESRLAYTQALAIDPKCLDAFMGLAKSFADIDDMPQACAWYDKAIAAKPREPGIWHEKAMLQARFKDWDGALTSLGEAHRIDPDNRVYTRKAGLILARAGRFEDASATLARCMKEEEVHYTLARMHQHLNQPDACREQLKLAIKAHPTYAPARELLSELDQGGVRTVGFQTPGQVRVDGIE